MKKKSVKFRLEQFIGDSNVSGKRTHKKIGLVLGLEGKSFVTIF